MRKKNLYGGYTRIYMDHVLLIAVSKLKLVKFVPNHPASPYSFCNSSPAFHYSLLQITHTYNTDILCVLNRFRSLTVSQ